MKATSWIGLCARALLAALAAAGVATGCGGGVGEGGTGSVYSQGTITGFGSIFVNDIRFDDSAALVQDDTGATRSRDELRLGMTVEVESGAIDAGTASASATLIRFGSELLGPVAGVDAARGLVTLLGQTVEVDAATVFDERLAGIGALGSGRTIEVYGNYDAGSGRYRATRIAPGSGAYSLRGIVGSLDRSRGVLRIGAADFVYAGAAPAGLASGDYVRLTLQPGPAGATSWNVSAFAAGVRTIADRDEAELHGFVTAFTSVQAFSVNGQPVNAAAATFPDGSAIGLGVRRVGRHAPDAQRHRDVGERAELGQEVVELIDEPQVPIAPRALLGGVHRREVAPHQGHAAAGRRLEAAEQVQQRALARPRRADDGQRLAGVHVQVDAAQHVHVEAAVVEALVERAALQHEVPGGCVAWFTHSGGLRPAGHGSRASSGTASRRRRARARSPRSARRRRPAGRSACG